jgi:hypothetical protein
MRRSQTRMYDPSFPELMDILADNKFSGHNCQRGGFVCEGYAAKSPWPKPSVSKQLPMPIQARDPYVEAGNGNGNGNIYPR